MKLFLKRLLLILLLVFIVIQFIRPAKNKSGSIGENDITKIYTVPLNVETILKRSCYDCHSNNTVYPWYTEIQPIGWWLNNHIKEGKEELNFSEFGSYDTKDQQKKLHEICEELKLQKMPLKSYLWIHQNAKITSQERKDIVRWADTLINTIDLNSGY